MLEESAVAASKERIQPLFIRGNGPSVIDQKVASKALYACHHEAQTRNKKATPIVICSPLGHEYERCHRAVKQLASALAKVGFDVLRFDYSGTGNSTGEYADADFEDWLDDTHRAIDFLKQRTGVSHVAMIGLRLGATIAYQVACQREDIVSSVLWSPCLEGQSLLDYWEAVQKGHQQALGYDNSEQSPTEVLGFPLTHKVRQQLSALIITPEQVLSQLGGVSMVIDEPLIKWQQALPATSQVNLYSSDGSQMWEQEAMQARVPMQSVQAIVSELQGALR